MAKTLGLGQIQKLERPFVNQQPKLEVSTRLKLLQDWLEHQGVQVRFSACIACLYGVGGEMSEKSTQLTTKFFFVLDRLERRDRAEGEVTCIITLPGELQCYMFLRLTKGRAREGGNYSELICMQIDGLRLEGGFAQGAGVMATKEFKKGEMMLVVPATAMMTSATAICSKVCNPNLFWF